MLINGHPLRCSHCKGASFSHAQAQLNTAGMSFLNLDWMNKSADTFACSDCGHIEWFLEPEISDEGSGVGQDCARCGFHVSESVAVCPNCGEPR